ncbi:hypothetical protein Mesau_04151 [Mesorhizobium australicum WSM2073]|uniref:Uncharacterized protein n=1 Tax=Mesorhizobium australicum (strain HAMBI 3006 / LMG 24608 / WSM2073) TaxID=754035 RepID=L0KR65_MESAW|nr:hypothetical protein Mesau_04151 [Mesorhizobium australicum WSM2073]
MESVARRRRVIWHDMLGTGVRQTGRDVSSDVPVSAAPGQEVG